MQREQRSFISLIATFGMLAFVLSLWVKPPVPSAESDVQKTHKHQVFCAGASSSFYLAEIKTRFSGTATNNPAFVVAIVPSFRQKIVHFTPDDNLETRSASPPLWLLNRSLLI